MVKNPPVMPEMLVQSLGWEDPLEKEMATHSSILAWEVLWTEKPGGLQIWGSHGSDTTWRLNHYHILRNVRRLKKIKGGVLCLFNAAHSSPSSLLPGCICAVRGGQYGQEKSWWLQRCPILKHLKDPSLSCRKEPALALTTQGENQWSWILGEEQREEEEGEGRSLGCPSKADIFG